MNAQGNAIVVYEKTPGILGAPTGPTEVWMSAFDGGSGTWTTPKRISNPAIGPATKPQVALTNAGSAYVVWVQGLAGGVSRIYETRMSTAGSLSTPAAVGTGTADDNPQIAANIKGANLVYEAKLLPADATTSIVSAVYRGGAWEFLGPIETWDSTTPMLKPQVALDSKGRATSVFVRNRGSLVRSTYVNHFR